MKILSIESSCDETAVAILEDGRLVLANVIASQIDLHSKTGGVVPEVAAREHVKVILPVLHEAFQQAADSLKQLGRNEEAESMTWDQIDAIAVTKEPGLVGSVMVGRMCAATLAFLHEKPLIEVNHIHGHIYSNWLIDAHNKTETTVQEQVEESPSFPILTLTVSGGHNELYLLKEHGSIESIGQSIDDAAGEAFDKAARMLGLGYPGGPVIEKTALQYEGPVVAERPGKLFPRAQIQGYDYSFSGVKTSVLYHLKRNEAQLEKARTGDPSDSPFIQEVAYEFQTAVVDALVKKLLKAADDYDVQEVHLAGGVSANKALRQRVEKELKKRGQLVRWPESIRFCTDNAAMIGAAAYYLNK